MSNYIDKIIYINLERRTDRRQQIEEELNNFNLPFERFEAISYEPGSIGCALSHIAVLEKAKENGYNNILILEDDFMFVVSKEEFENNLKEFFESKISKKFDVIKLAYNLRQGIELTNINIGKIIDSATTAGFIVNKHYYQKLIDLFQICVEKLKAGGEHWIWSIDRRWVDLQKVDNFFYFKTRLGKQRPSFSDLSKTFVDFPDC